MDQTQIQRYFEVQNETGTRPECPPPPECPDDGGVDGIFEDPFGNGSNDDDAVLGSSSGCSASRGHSRVDGMWLFAGLAAALASVRRARRRR